MFRQQNKPQRPGFRSLAVLLLFLQAWLLLAACAQPASVPPPAEKTPPALSESDRHFVLEAAGAGLYRLEAARLAELRATDPMLKAYAAMLVQQNSAANDELRALAQLRGVVWLGAPPAARRELLNKALANLTGEAFDRRFAELVGVADHEADLLLFEAAGRTVEDPTLRAWAQRMVAALHRHLVSARQLPLLQRPVA